MKKRFLVLLTLSVSALPFAANAAEAEKGFYLGLEGGLSLPNDADITGPGISLNSEYNTGADFGLTLGYRYGNGVRAEFELETTLNDLDKLNSGGAVGDIQTGAFMVNALYDYTSASAFTPYIGIGGGLMSFRASDAGPVGGVLVDDTDTTWGAQGIIGASYAVNNWMDAFTQYKLVYADDPNLSNTAGTSVDFEHTNNILQVGIRIDLSPEAFTSSGSSAAASVGTKTAAAAPEKEPYVSTFSGKKDFSKNAGSSYLVFFDFDKSTLSKEAKEIIKKVSEEMKEKKIVRIEVTGHADRAGSEKYNQGLSERRAQAVKNELVKLGVKKSEVTTFAKGESSPLVPTADNVREPQNRRVEVVYPPE